MLKYLPRGAPLNKGQTSWITFEGIEESQIRQDLSSAAAARP